MHLGGCTPPVLEVQCPDPTFYPFSVIGSQVCFPQNANTMNSYHVHFVPCLTGPQDVSSMTKGALFTLFATVPSLPDT